MVLCSSLILLMLERERDKALLRAILVGGVWNGFLLSPVRGQAVPCRFCGAPDNDGHLFGECPFPSLVEIRENPEFHDLMRMDKAHWPRCLLWHGWLPALSGVNGDSPWAVGAAESAAYMVEVALGRYSSSRVTEWDLSGDFDHQVAAASLAEHPDVWTDGSLVLDQVTGISSSGSRVWKRLRQEGCSHFGMPDHSRRRCDHADGGSVHEHDRVGVG